ncbi:MAG: GyrI-like domain-containing protein [Candidatus Velthaea sp.]
MAPSVSVQVVPTRKLAAVRRQVRLGAVGSVWGAALDLVWAYLRSNPGLRTDGHNVFLYRHPENRDASMDVDFGVEVTRSFERSGEVRETDTPAGVAAVATHIGAYDRLSETHHTIHAWAAANKRTFAGYSMEIYGDWSDDASKLETTVVYFLE